MSRTQKNHSAFSEIVVNSTFWAIEEEGVFRPKIGQNRKMTKNKIGEMSLNGALLLIF